MLEFLLIFIFIRPFISSLAFPCANFIYSALLLILIFIWIMRKRISLKEIEPIKYALLLFILAVFSSVIFSQDRAISVKELYKYISGVSLFIIATSLSFSDKNRVILFIVSAAFVISLLAIYQYFFGFQHLSNYVTKKGISDPFILDYISQKRPFYPFVTPNTLAGYLAMIIPLTLIYRKRRWFIVPIFIALLLTKSLGALLSLLLGLILYFYIQGRLDKKRIILLSGLLMVICLIFTLRILSQKQHTQPIFSTFMRLDYWQNTLKIISEHPLAGIGLGNFNLIRSRYAHNSYLQIWAEMGILGIISFLWLVIAILKFSLKKLKDSLHKFQIASLIAATVIFLIHNFVDFTFFLPEVSLIWWVILGCDILPRL